MITSQTKKVYTVNGQEFTSLEEAQTSALAKVLEATPPFAKEWHQTALELARALIPHADEIVDILTTRPGSLARARKVNGGKKPRKAKAAQPATDPSSHQKAFDGIIEAERNKALMDLGQEVLKGAQ